ncbi:Aromatic amino acid transport protein AroP [compost metagenome]
MLLGLAEQGDAPKALGKVDKRGVPVRALLVSALVTFLAVVINYVMPQSALELLMSLVVAALVINWAMISYSHLKFRKQMDRDGVRSGFRALWYPFSNYLCLAFVLFILGVMLLIPGIQVSVYAIPVWLLVMWGCYRLKLSSQAAQVRAAADYSAG